MRLQAKTSEYDVTAFRHELKYLVSGADLEVLRLRLRALMARDAHADARGRYLVRSIYFDDTDNSAYHDNEEGIAERKKWRIRAYNASDAVIMLECKEKIAAMTLKKACPLQRKTFDAIMNSFAPGPVPRLSALPAYSSSEDALLRLFLTECRVRPLVPRVIVQYEREPYLFSSGNVRVTFDTFISSSGDVSSFFAERLPVRPVMLQGQQILEVKYDAYLPDPVYHAVQMRDLRQETFSKYYLCRRLIR